MTLAFFKYGLPILLGYTLFVGISGRLNPFLRPHFKEEIPSWLLGIWTGLAISTVLSVALHMAYWMPSDSISSVLLPGLALLAILIAPALFLFARYRNVNDETPFARPSLDQVTSNDDQLQSRLFDSTISTEHAMDETLVHTAYSLERLSQNDPAYAMDAFSQLDDVELHEKLASETALREETEQHLRITRKALSVLEAETRHFSIDKADGIISLEEQLAKSIEAAAVLESDALREKARRIELEQNAAELKQKMVKAKQEIRRSAAARARALSTANKSIAFARQCVQVRTRLETSLDEAQTIIESRQKTVSSLIRALEKQKRKTRQEVSSMARQLILHEKQLKARKSLEEVARSVENKLSTRLVKKVAKAKPLITGMDQDEAS